MDYFLISLEDWSIPAQRFIHLLQSSWPGVVIKPGPIPGGHRAFEFQLPMRKSTLDGSLNSEGSAIIFYAAPRDCADFALWYQATVPEARPLLLCDEGNNRRIELKPETTAEDIVRALSDEPEH